MAKQREPYKDALDAADRLREDLEAISNSDLPFSRDAEKILEALKEAERELNKQ